MPNGQTTVRVNRLWYGYANAMEKWMQRVERAADEGAAGKYTPQSFLSDIVSTWSDAADVWYLPYKICDERLRVVVFEITQATDDQVETILIPDPGAVVLEVDDFVDGGGNVVIAGSANANPQVDVDTADNGLALVVGLFGLLANPPPLGTYESPVHPHGSTTQIALVRVIVSA